MGKYSKFWVAAVIGVVAVLNSFYGPDNTYTTLAIAVATAFGVYRIPNQ